MKFLFLVFGLFFIQSMVHGQNVFVRDAKVHEIEGGVMAFEISDITADQGSGEGIRVNHDSEEDGDDFSYNVSFFPNPTKGGFQVIFNKPYHNVDVVMRNYAGLVKDARKFCEVQSFYMDIKGAAGLYYVELMTDEGDKILLKVYKED
ncbi:hypothetical protein RCC89_16170 [Cytophagaceae bacterium ABcell3]|nr:hypothetical protein RCC89_16170 [Cytophagaceae bacterium ABcell3]